MGAVQTLLRRLHAVQEMAVLWRRPCACGRNKLPGGQEGTW